MPALYLAVGQPFLPPGGSAWAICLIWAASGTAGYLVDKVRLHFPRRGLRSHAWHQRTASPALLHKWTHTQLVHGSCTSPARWA